LQQANSPGVCIAVEFEVDHDIPAISPSADENLAETYRSGSGQ
jgi:hypothetical protein